MTHCCDSPSKAKSPSINSRKVIPVLIAIFTALTFGIGAWAISQTASSSLTQNADAKFYSDHFSYDWEQIPINGGETIHEFTVENRGTGSLELASIQTSCMCTSAQVIIGGKTSPFFGMHTSSSWTGKVAPGEQATLRVIFDPLAHGPDAVGPIERFIAVETNDPKNSRLEFRLTGNVVK